MSNLAIFGFYRNLKTKNKLITSFLCVTLIFLVVAGIFQFANSTIINGYDLAINSPIKAALHMDQATLYILESRLNNEKFMVKNEIGFLKEADKNISQVLVEMDAVKACAQKAGRDDLLPVFTAIENLHKDYKTKFDSLMAALKNSESPEKVQQLIAEGNASVLKLKTTIDNIQVEARKDATKFVEMTQMKSKKLSQTAAVIAVIAALIGIVFSIFISVGISNPIGMAVNFAEEISKGNFTKSLDLDRKDEVGVLATALNQMKNNLSNMINELKDTSQKLAGSSQELSAVSSQMASSSDTTSQRANNVSAASEEMSANISAVAAAMEESSTNTGMVATAAEQMSATINEISQNAEKARSISDNAVHQSRNAGEKMNELGQAAQAIGKVTETIAEISEQTNLLALNATIEAARAGEAGKGFAVVANEIKELAKQTANATLDIKTQIDGMQQTTSSTVTEIGQISNVIDDINEIVGTIATAVEEQSSATKDIAVNIGQASQGIQEVNENISQSSQMASTITEDITMVSSQTQEVSNGTNQVNISAEDLNRFSEQLNQMVSRFQV
jgi:methyl-accepting chemotaxis protein